MRGFIPSPTYAAQFPALYDAEILGEGYYKSFSISAENDTLARDKLVKAGFEHFHTARFSGNVVNRKTGHGFKVICNNGRLIAETEF